MAIKLNYALVGAVVTVTAYRGEKFSDSEKEIIAEASFDAAEVPAVLTDGNVGEKSLAGYGLLKLLQDRTSQEKDPAGKIELMENYFYGFFKAGQWKKPVERKESTGGSSVGRRKVDTTLAQAVANLYNIELASAVQSLKALSKDEFANIQKHPKVVAAMDEIKAGATETADLTDLLSVAEEATDE